MVICVCNAIRENQVRDAARCGASTACQVYRALGYSPKCGQCSVAARLIIDQELAAA